MRDISQYFDIVDSLIRHSMVIDDQVSYIGSGHRGIIDGVLYFADGSRLVFTEIVEIRNYRPIKETYRYQYMRDDQTSIRYDNSPHHPHLPTFPHHKHEGDNIIASAEVTLQQVLDEIAILMFQ